MAKPDFTGRWEFDAEASSLQIQVPEAVVFSIQHNEPCFRIERTLVVGGQSDMFVIELEVGKDLPPVSRGTATLHPSLDWEDDQLVFLTRVSSDDGEEATNLVRYRLERNGAVLVAEERFRSPDLEYENRWVFAKQ